MLCDIKIIDKENIGLYRDNDLIIKGPNGPKLDRYRKKTTNTWKLLGVKNVIKTNLKITNFTDISLKFR